MASGRNLAVEPNIAISAGYDRRSAAHVSRAGDGVARDFMEATDQ
jgi:hypothetical protein